MSKIRSNRKRTNWFVYFHCTDSKCARTTSDGRKMGNHFNIHSNEFLRETANSMKCHWINMVTSSMFYVQYVESDKKEAQRFFFCPFFIRPKKNLIEMIDCFFRFFLKMFRTKFARVADDTFYALGGNNAFNYSKAVDKIEGFMSPVFAAISARMEGPNRDRYGFIYRVNDSNKRKALVRFFIDFFSKISSQYNGSNGFNVTIHSGSKNPFIKGKFINFSSE